MSLNPFLKKIGESAFDVGGWADLVWTQMKIAKFDVLVTKN